MTRVDVDAELARIRQRRRHREASAGRAAKPNGRNGTPIAQLRIPGPMRGGKMFSTRLHCRQ
jgi:hypothetical protein